MVSDRSPGPTASSMPWPTPPAARSIRQLSRGERNLSELASPLRMTFPAATKHVRVLERATLVRRRSPGGSTSAA